MSQDMELVERLETDADVLDAFGSNDFAPTIREAAARIQELEAAVEQAFRDGLAYGTNVAAANPDLAWQHSRARSALEAKP